ncbi:MAG: AMP-binding protein, partial [Vulcanimicrobiaceae bacterium]
MSKSPLEGTLAAIVDDRAADSADRPFLTCADVTLSYGDFADRVWRLAGALREMGIGPADKLCLFLPNGLPFVLGMFAAARLGAVFVPA